MADQSFLNTTDALRQLELIHRDYACTFALLRDRLFYSLTACLDNARAESPESHKLQLLSVSDFWYLHVNGTENPLTGPWCSADSPPEIAAVDSLLRTALQHSQAVPGDVVRPLSLRSLSGEQLTPLVVGHGTHRRLTLQHQLPASPDFAPSADVVTGIFSTTPPDYQSLVAEYAMFAKRSLDAMTALAESAVLLFSPQV